MGTRTRLSTIAAIVMFAGLAVAQVKKGSAPPQFTFGRVWNDGPKSFAELAGKVVIVEYSYSEHEVCKQSVPHFNELHKKYASRGLIVLGVSSEPEATIETQFIKGRGAVYPWVKSNDFREKWKVQFLPCCFCIDAYGNLHSLGDWWAPDEATIEELLEALPLPPPVPPEKLFDPLRGMWARSEFAAMKAQLDKLLAMPKLEAAPREALLAQQKALEERQAKWLARVTDLGKRQDYASAAAELGRIVKAWGDLPPGSAAQKELARFDADPKIKAEVTAGVALQKLMAGVDTAKIPQLRAVIVELDKFRKKYAGTWAGKRADFHHTRLCSRPDGS